jgi:hypothetical protein
VTSLAQLNLSVDHDFKDKVFAPLAERYASKREALETATETLALLLSRYEKLARKAEPDVGALFMRVAHKLPARLADAKVEHARFADGRAALLITLAHDDRVPWVIAPDANDDLMAIRKDGSQIGHLTHGTIEILADHALGEIRPLQRSVAELALH